MPFLCTVGIEILIIVYHDIMDGVNNKDPQHAAILRFLLYTSPTVEYCFMPAGFCSTMIYNDTVCSGLNLSP